MQKSAVPLVIPREIAHVAAKDSEVTKLRRWVGLNNANTTPEIMTTQVAALMDQNRKQSISATGSVTQGMAEEKGRWYVSCT